MRDLHVNLKGKWRNILGGIICQYIHGLATQGVHYIHRSGPILQDASFYLLPELGKDKAYLSETVFTLDFPSLCFQEHEYSVSATHKACNLAYYCLSQNPKAIPLMSDVVETFEPLQGSGGVKEVSSSSSLTPTLMCGGSPFVSGRIPDYRMHHKFGRTIDSAVGCRSSNPNCSSGGSVTCRVR